MRFSIIAGVSQLTVYDFEPDETFKSSQYFATNVFYEPIETIDVGIEFTGGNRINKNNQNGQASRISLLARFDF